MSSEMIGVVIVTAVFGVPILLAAFLWLSRRQLREARAEAAGLRHLASRFANVIDADAEERDVKERAAALRDKISEMQRDYAEKFATYQKLKHEVAIFDERIAFAEMGVYEPHFDFTDSEEYKRAIEAVRDRQKEMVTAKTAVICTKQWTVDGNAAKGQTMTNRNIRLTLRAFNNECDAAVANARWNNVNAMEKRITRAREQIDNMNESNAIYITGDFHALKLRELFLTHEYREKLKQEREQRAEAARAAKEEQKLLRDMEKAEDEEARYQRLLAKAKAEAASITGPQLDVFASQIKMLERDLAEAHARVERAQAMAEKTRSGYVYIISNVGSFGEEVVKIGLTRRLDPADRVRELGDASVPFEFDTHAIIYSDDAPTLERALHTEFQSTRVNAQNFRKEFFKARIDDVELAVRRLAPGAPFFRDIEAQEYRETLARRKLALEGTVADDVELFPAAI